LRKIENWIREVEEYVARYKKFGEPLLMWLVLVLVMS
jgi:hypothetical protein